MVHSLLCRLFGFQVECMLGRAAAALASTHVQVCGGNAGDLLSAVQDFQVLKDWTSGEQLLCDDGWSFIMPSCHVSRLLAFFAMLQP